MEERIRREAERLERHFDRIIGCNVVVDSPHHRSRTGNLYSVGVELRVPGGPPLVAGRTHHDDHAHEDAYVAIRDAFAAARRQLQTYAEKLRAEVKSHDAPDHGQIERLELADRFGFILSSDGTPVYFHENALVDAELEDLEPGDEVRFVVHPGEGAKGAQASTVHRIGKHHPTPAGRGSL